MLRPEYFRTPLRKRFQAAEKLELPDYITHYYEADYGPFLNICDLEEAEIENLVKQEENAPTAFNRFAMGPDFIRWRIEADNLLMRAYT